MSTFVPVVLNGTGWSVTLSRVGNVVSGVFNFAVGTPTGSVTIPASFLGDGDAERIFISPDEAVEAIVQSGIFGSGILVAAPNPPLLKPYVLSAQWLGATVPGVTTSAPVVAPYVPTYASTQPYATAAEFNNYPTGVNSFEIVPGATQQVLADTLAQLLVQASSEADGICNQVLACTTEVEYGRRRVDSAGMLQVPVNQFPLVEVDDLQVGVAGSPLSSLPDLSQGVFPSRNVFRVPYSGATDSGWVDMQITYLAGYANGLLVSAMSAGASSVTLTSTLGVQPGMTLRVYDPGATENVVVSGVAGSQVTLVSPLTYAHAAGVGVSSMPAAIREAVILLTAVKIKARASQATVMPSLGGAITQKPDTQPEEYSAAVKLLNPFVRV